MHDPSTKCCMTCHASIKINSAWYINLHFYISLIPRPNSMYQLLYRCMRNMIYWTGNGAGDEDTNDWKVTIG